MTQEQLAVQLPTLLLLACGGAAAGLFYDILRFFRLLWVKQKWLCTLIDVLYVLAAACWFLWLLVQGNGGRISVYALFAAACGMALYMAGAGCYVRKVTQRTASFLKKRWKKRRKKQEEEN